MSHRNEPGSRMPVLTAREYRQGAAQVRGLPWTPGDRAAGQQQTPAISKLDKTHLDEWLHRAILLLETAVGQLRQEHPAQCTLLEATSLLRQQIHTSALVDAADGGLRLLTWQARKVCDYIEGHITEPVLVADLCALVRRSEAHFSRAFKRTFGESPHAFIVRRRVELAARYMLTTDGPLSEIALRCGFTDQAHLCKQFRQATGQPPAAWRRAQKTCQGGERTPHVGRPAIGLGFSRPSVE
jgi:AraC family transcriptional regulator